MSYEPNIALHPGYTLSRVLEGEGMSQKSLSERTGLTEKHISQIINGEASITVDTALLFENALGGTASFWVNVEKHYQEIKARLDRRSQIAKEINLASKFPYKELVKRGYVEQTRDIEERVENLWKFFGANSLLFVEDTNPVAYRKKINLKIKSEYIATWLRCGELEVRKNVLPEYSEARLKELLPQLKALSVKPPKEFLTAITDMLHTAGVGLVYVPHFPGTGVSGAVRWVGNNPLIQLSIYYPWVDIFWFNLYHEIGHLILHGKKDKFIEFDDKELSTVQDKELQADDFAKEALIPMKIYSKFMEKPLTKAGVIGFAKALNIHPSIVAGRLCHDKKTNWKSVSSLRPRLEFV